LRDYDYANAGAYFVTICCKDRVNYFGEIVNEKMILNEYGYIAYDEWGKLQERYLENKFDVFQIMPDHIHGIINIRVTDTNTTIGRIVGAYKSLVFARCLEISNENKCVLGKLWQRNYWEHIIRNETEYTKIAEYICDNPVLWGKKRLGEILPKKTYKSVGAY